MECSHVPNSILELPCVLCHPCLPASLGMTAKLLTTSKAVAAAASTARSNQLQELQLSMPDSSTAQQAAAWMTKHADLLQGVNTLKLQLPREDIDEHSARPGNAGQSTICAAAILQSMPRTLASVDLQLLRDYDVAATPLHDCECAMLRSQLAALPSLQDISIVGLGAAACLSPGLDLAATFSQLTSIYLGSITSHAGVEKLLPALPASLVQLGLAVDTPDRLTPGAVISDSDRQWLVQLQRGVQMAHLTALTALDVAGTRFVIGEDSQLPPNLVSLKVPMVMHERPLLQLTRLQHLDVHNLDMLGAGGLAGIARCLTQLTSLKAVWMRLEDADAPAIIPALAALPLKSLNVMSYGPPQPAAADDINFPAALGALLGQLTGLASLELATGSYRVPDVAASLAHLTGLKVLALSTAADQGGRSGLWGSVASYEALADAIVASKQLRVLRAAAYWLGPAAAEAGRPHPIMRLQAATQLSCLDLCDLEDLGPADDAVQQPDWETLLHSLPGVELCEELTLLRVKLLEAQLEQLTISFSSMAETRARCERDLQEVKGNVQALFEMFQGLSG